MRPRIVRLMRGEPTLPFHYRDKGTLATIGKAAAVADIAGCMSAAWSHG